MPPSPQVTEPWRHSLGRGCRKLAWGAPTLALLVPSSLASGLPRLPGVGGGGGGWCYYHQLLRVVSRTRYVNTHTQH